MIKKCAILAIAAAYLSGCTTTDPYTGEQKMSNTAGGALLGAGLGAATGLLVGGSAAGRRDAALVGAGIGALGGGLVGNYMDQQESELRAQLQGTGVSVTRAGDRIILNMPSNITFATDRDQVVPAFYSTLDSVAIVLRKFNRTLIDVDGHTDSTGSAATTRLSPSAARLRLRTSSAAAGSTSAASRPWAMAWSGRSHRTPPRPAVRKTAASKSRSRRSSKADPRHNGSTRGRRHAARPF